MRNQIRKFDRGGLFPSLFNSYFNDNFFPNFNEGNLPAVNVSEDEKSFIIQLSVPGFTKEDINVEIDNDVLKISASTEESKEEKDENQKVLRQEFRKSSFKRSFTIPENVDVENILASQNDGVLTISLPKMDKAPEDKVKRIEIK